jgi:DNA-binding transcriptional MerR regulator
VPKGPEAFRTISEAADEVGVAQHVLRFWETRFSFIRPMKRAGGRRFYRPQDIQVLRGVHRLLHDEGYTIAGVQKLYREHGSTRLSSAGGAGGEDAAPPEAAASGHRTAAPGSLKAALASALEELLQAKSRLDQALASKGR